MRVEIRAAQPGDGTGLAQVWLENARYYVRLFPDDFQMPDQVGLVESFEARLGRPPSATEIHLVAVVDGVVAAFVSARLTEPDEGATREMLADRPHRRVHVEALGTANAFQRQGIATRLVEAVETWACEQGARIISAGTYLESPVAIPFWEERMGYRRRSVILAKRLEVRCRLQARFRFVERPPNRPLTRKRRAAADLGASWKEHAEPWVVWARKPGHDSYWCFHRDLFLASVPAAGRKTLDVGCGEGRLSRDLKALGHDVVGVDVSPTMLEAAQDADQQIETHLADAAELPFPDATFDCVVAFMSLQDIDDLRGATREVQRVLEPRGRFCLAIVHPLNSAGSFEGNAVDSPFVISGSYLEESFYEDNVARDGLEMTFVSAHRPLHAYTDAINEAGLLIERLDEPAAPEHAITRPQSRRWQRLPLFLHLRAIRP